MPLGLGPDDDLDVAIEESDEAQQPFGGEAVQLVVLELRDVGLRNAEQLRRARLRQTAARDQLVEPHRKLNAKLPLVGIREAKIDQHVTTSRVDRLRLSLLSSHSAPRSPFVPFSGARGSAQVAGRGIGRRERMISCHTAVLKRWKSITRRPWKLPRRTRRESASLSFAWRPLSCASKETFIPKRSSCPSPRSRLASSPSAPVRRDWFSPRRRRASPPITSPSTSRRTSCRRPRSGWGGALLYRAETARGGSTLRAGTL